MEAPAVLTANDLRTGRIAWWTGTGWTRAYRDAARAVTQDARQTFEEAARREEAADRVVGAAIVPLDAEGLREGRRALGPSIDLPATNVAKQDPAPRRLAA